MVMMMSQATTFVDRFVQWSVLVIRLRYQGTCIAPSTIVASFFVPLLPLGIRLGITAYRHAPILRSLLRQRPLLDARAQTIDVTYLIY
jgi:hypothetical protein